VLIPAPAYRVFREAYRRGDGETVLGTAQLVLDQLNIDERQQGLRPAVWLMVGASLAAAERSADAVAYLEQGLRELPGSAATREVGEADWYALTLLDLRLRLGRYQAAWSLVEVLIEPARRLETRLGATRAQLALHATFGRFETAQHLLNTAAGLADRLRNHQLLAMVDGDRAIVLAMQGRTVEAAAFADQVLPSLTRPGRGAELTWSAAQAVTIATTVARHAATAGDTMTAERMLFLAADPTERTDRRFDRGQLDLASGVVWREGGRLAESELALFEARRTFVALDCGPAAALAQREAAWLAAARGLTASARPLFERARDEFAGLGLVREAGELEAVLRR
jgi:tetratricopeptide (TPR) repeat protein